MGLGITAPCPALGLSVPRHLSGVRAGQTFRVVPLPSFPWTLLDRPLIQPPVTRMWTLRTNPLRSPEDLLTITSLPMKRSLMLRRLIPMQLVKPWHRWLIPLMRTMRLGPFLRNPSTVLNVPCLDRPVALVLANLWTILIRRLVVHVSRR